MARKAKPKKGGKKGKKKTGGRRRAAGKKAPARKKSVKPAAAKIAARPAPAATKIAGVKIGGEMRPRFSEILREKAWSICDPASVCLACGSLFQLKGPV